MRFVAKTLLLFELCLCSITHTALAEEASSTGRRGKGPPQPNVPAMLTRIASAIVKVRCGDAWGTGIVYESTRHVVTAYTLVNISSEIAVVTSDGKWLDARVVAWSEEDDLAVLELRTPVTTQPVHRSTQAPYAGMPIVMLYHPRDANLDPDEAETRAAPVARFGRVGHISPAELDLDVDHRVLWGDVGAPIVTERGEVIGVLSHGKAGRGRVTATRAGRVDELLDNRGRQGDFAPDVVIRQSAGVFVTPVYDGLGREREESRRFFGAGIEWGICFDWFCPNVPLGFFTSTPRRLNDATVETVRRLELDLHTLARITLARNCRLYLGPGLAASLSEVTTSTATSDGSLDIENDNRGRARGQLVLGASFVNFFGGSIFIRDVFTVASDAEFRVDFGIVFGR